MDGWVTGVFVYIVVWWVVLFAVLPFGVRTPDNPEPGMASSAPVEPKMLRKIIATSLVSLVVWLIIYAIAHSGLISFREMVKDL
jgi:predicted secreted protein